ncbi:MAG: hypothetical protein IKL89_01305 [Clostridia bacterium]|nr:hypothetical protein [Clostridia bacterium]
MGDREYALLLIGGVILVSLIGWFVTRLVRVLKMMKTINLEIARNRGAERRYWKARRRRLLLSLFPFVRF